MNTLIVVLAFLTIVIIHFIIKNYYLEHQIKNGTKSFKELISFKSLSGSTTTLPILSNLNTSILQNSTSSTTKISEEELERELMAYLETANKMADGPSPSDPYQDPTKNTSIHATNRLIRPQDNIQVNPDGTVVYTETPGMPNKLPRGDIVRAAALTAAAEEGLKAANSTDYSFIQSDKSGQITGIVPFNDGISDSNYAPY